MSSTRNSIKNHLHTLWKPALNKILLVFALLLLIVMVIFNPILNGIVKSKLISSLNEDKNINVRAGYLSYNFFSAGLSIEDIKIEFKNPSFENSASSEIKIPFTRFTGLNTLKLIFGDGLSFSDLEITNGSIFLNRDELKKRNDSTEQENEDSFYKKIKESIPARLKPLSFEQVNMSNLLVNQIINGKEYKDSLKKAQVEFKNLKIDSDISNKTFKFADDFDLTVEGVSVHLSNDYQLKIKRLDVSGSDSTFNIKDLYYKPFVSDEEFFSHRQFSSDRYSITFSSLMIHGIDFKKLTWKNVYFLKNIEVERMDLSICTNRLAPPDKSSTPQMPNEIMRSLKNKIDIQKIQFKNCRLNIQARNPYVEKYSEVLFTNLNADIKNISSLANLQTDENPCIINASADLYGEGKLKVKMNLPLLEENLSFTYIGNLTSMSTLPINNQIESADKVKLKSGEIDSVNFSVQVINGAAHVHVEPFYKELKIENLKKNAEEGGIIKKAGSFIANTFVIRSSNPDDEGKKEIANIIYLKEKDDTFMDLVWTALKKGLGEVVGF